MKAKRPRLTMRVMNLETILKADTPLHEWEWTVLDHAIDHYDAILDSCNKQWDQDVIEHCVKELTRIEERLNQSIRRKRPLKLTRV